MKECGVLCVFFGFISHTKMTNLAKKERKRTVPSFLGLKKNLKFFFAIYIYICIFKSIYIYIYIYIYIEKKNEGWACILSKERNVLCSFRFFYILSKRTLRSLRSFTFFAKECAFFTFFYVLKKRTQNNALFFWVS